MSLTETQIQHAEIMVDNLYDDTDNCDPLSERAYGLRKRAFQIHMALKRYGEGIYRTKDIQIVIDAGAEYTAAQAFSA